jgi:hypothetical protein
MLRFADDTACRVSGIVFRYASAVDDLYVVVPVASQVRYFNNVTRMV